MCNDTGSSTTIIHCVKDSHISPEWTYSRSIRPPSNHQDRITSSTSGKYGKLSQIFRELIFRFINWRRRFFSSLNSTAFVRAQSGEIYANGCHRGTCGVDAFFVLFWHIVWSAISMSPSPTGRTANPVAMSALYAFNL